VPLPTSPSTDLPSAAALAARAVDVALQDGAPVQVRPVRPEDLPALRGFLEGLSAAARRMRFFTPATDLAAAARWAAEVDRHDRDGLLATTGAGEIVGHAAWARIGPDRAEVAFEVGEAMQGKGLATILLAHLAFGARVQGIATFVAEVLPENHKMLGVFRDSRLPLQVRSEPGVLIVEMPTAFTDEARERFRQRERLSAVHAIDAILRPRSIAVVGASPDPGTIGGALFQNLLEAGFTGALHAVNRRARAIGGHHCHRSLDEVAGELDLVVLAIPAADVLPVARACGVRGVRALTVITAGFAERGPDGAARQRELLRICRSTGMRLVGPNALGVLNTDAGIGLDATFAPTHPPPGGVTLVSQSGGVGIALLEQARALGIGIAAFASIGNGADLMANDFIEWAEQDERTRSILLYLEAFGDPRRFAQIAPRVGERKPIAAVKAARTPAGARAASSHTGVLVGGSELAADALFRQAGVLRVDTLGELFDLAGLLERQPLPTGSRVGILTNAGGPGTLAADACQAAGLELPTFSEELCQRLAAIVPESAGLQNPVDLLVDASPQAFADAVAAIGCSGAVDALIAVFVPRPFAHTREVALALRRAVARLNGCIPLLPVFMTSAASGLAEDVVEGEPIGRHGAAEAPDAPAGGGRGIASAAAERAASAASRAAAAAAGRAASAAGRQRASAAARAASVAAARAASAAAGLAASETAASPPADPPPPALPTFRYPEEAARALARATQYAEWRASPRGSVPELSRIDHDAGAAIIAEALARQREGGWLGALRAGELLRCFGLPSPEQRVVRSPTAAARAASELGGLVALKALAPDLARKSDLGGVLLGLAGPTAVRRAARAMRTRFIADELPLEGFVVQQMAPTGVELLVGMTSDPLFGPVVACGLGGRAVELLRDVAVRLTPVTDRGAHEMVRELATFPLLQGYRGAPVVDVAALEEIIVRVGVLASAHPEIVELDCNPVVVHTDGAVVVDARVRIAPAPPPVPTPAL
jgi:acyl-CoA synthetase (NDP forming)/RimJ/RimL family protein N-acetyltransferase